jgi:large subunit ribosomal protein L21
MYAVIETGGKQYRVELGTELAVERLDAVPGTSINFDRVLLVADGDGAQVGTPTVVDALVTADVLRQDRGEKVIVFKYRPKARHRSKKGHRQEQTVIRVADIRFNGRSAAEEAGAHKAEESKARQQAQAEAQRKAAADQELATKLAAASEATEHADAQTADAATAESATAAPARKRPARAATSEEPTSATPDESDEAATDSKKTSRARTPRSSNKKDE